MRLVRLLPACLLVLTVSAGTNRTFYMDSAAGRDTADGLSPQTAWRSLERVNKARAGEIQPGDRVLFKRGGLWRGMLLPASGTKGNPVVYATYGEGPKPILQQSVDRSAPTDWVPAEGLAGVWRTKTTPPALGAEVPGFAGNMKDWRGCLLDGTKGGVKVMEENGEKFVRVTCEAPAKGRAKGRDAGSFHVWGPLVCDMPDAAVLTLRVRASKPILLDRVHIARPDKPWTAALTGTVKDAIRSPVTTTWCERTAVLVRPAGSTVRNACFHILVGDQLDAGGHLDFQILSLRKATLEDPYRIDRDVGIVVCDHGKAWGRKRMYGPHELADDLDYWYDPYAGNVFLKSARNPGERFASIELAKAVHVVSETNCHDVTYDGLAVRYGASHGFGGGRTENIVIRNCDIYWIGGGLQYWKTNAKGVRYPVRYGNGIEFWGTCRNNLVERCRLWQIYDAALTNQTLGDPRPEVDVTWRDNVVWQAEYSFEYWNHDPRSFTGNILFEHNTCIDAGYCWSHAQRPNPNGAHLMFYDNAAPTTNFVVRNNLFVRTTDRSTRLFNDWRVKNPAAHDGLEMYDNMYWIPEKVNFEYHVSGRDRKADPKAKPFRFGAGAEEFAKYQAATGLDRGSIHREPKFRDEVARDYRLVDGPVCPDGTVYGARDVPGLRE